MGGRVAMPAFTGFIAPSIIGTLPGDASHNFGELNPLNALTAVSQWGLVQIIIVIGGLEGQRYLKCVAGDNAAGDVGLGQGGFNPFNLNYSPAEYEEKQLQEIKHCRLAMLGVRCLVAEHSFGQGRSAAAWRCLDVPDLRPEGRL